MPTYAGPKIETRIASIADVKFADDSEYGSISGYASVKGEEDSYGDVILDGAYQGLEALVKDGWLSDGHNWYSVDKGVIGYFTEAKEDERGLFIKANFHSSETAQSVRQIAAERIAAGRSVGLSIGFFTKEAEDEEVDGKLIRKVKAMEIKEVSIVPIPAMKSAQISDVRGTGVAMEDQEAQVLDACRSHSKRWQDIAEKAETLSESRKTRIREFADAMETLVAQARSLVDAPAPEPEFDPEVLAQLEARANSLRK